MKPSKSVDTIRGYTIKEIVTRGPPAVTRGRNFFLANPGRSLVRCRIMSVQSILLNASTHRRMPTGRWDRCASGFRGGCRSVPRSPRRCGMSFDALVPGPDVVWSPDDPFDDPAALALHAQIHRLVQALW